MIDLTVISAALMVEIASIACVAYGALFGSLWVLGRVRKSGGL